MVSPDKETIMSDIHNRAVPKKGKKHEGKVVSISCRATQGCVGAQAAMKIIKKNTLGDAVGEKSSLQMKLKNSWPMPCSTFSQA